MTHPERRREPRIRKQYHAQINIEGANDWRSVILEDLSSGGMSFFYESGLNLGAGVKARINFPPSDEPVEVKGQIIRSTSKGSLYATAIGFYDISEKHTGLINHFAALWFPSK